MPSAVPVLPAFHVGRPRLLDLLDTGGEVPLTAVVAPPGAIETRLLLAKASAPEQESRIGAQTGGRVFLFLYTDDFWRDYERYKAQGVAFVREPKDEPYGIVAVFKDLYGNLWDLLEPKATTRGNEAV